ncbi:MAG: glycoside hydrolase family 140 protein [Bacteroidota bacterium]
MKPIRQIFFLLIVTFCICAVEVAAQERTLPRLKISNDKRSFVTGNNDPFFWLGDTGWLLFTKLTRNEAIQYLNDRQSKGFNVIQVMVLHDVKHAVNRYGDSALINNDVSKPKITQGNRFSDPTEYDFWDHVDYVISEAEKRGIYMALVPVWGSNVKSGLVSEDGAKKYATFLTNRYKDKSNIIWVNGGDIKGTDKQSVWKIIGSTIRSIDHQHLITFHPRGRSTSSEWFHKEDWLDFNMFQSGHKDYAQDTAEPRIGEDNWKFAQNDYALQPLKPTMDGEPSYENIPHGLHDSLAPHWHADDVRRYGYWSVFSGGAGFTYGDNAVMQFFNGIGIGDYFTKQKWSDAINDNGSSQVQYLKKLMLSKPATGRVPDQSLIANQGQRYEYFAAIRGNDYAFIYTYTGRNMQVNMGKIKGTKIKASWYDPRNGKYLAIGVFDNKGKHEFDPPGNTQNGNDWVLVLTSVMNP